MGCNYGEARTKRRRYVRFCVIAANHVNRRPAPQ